MKYQGWIVLILLLSRGTAGFAFDDTYDIQSRKFDSVPGDGFLDAGSPSNPWIILEHGQETGWEIRTQRRDSNPGDGFLDAGSPSNPWVIRRR